MISCWLLAGIGGPSSILEMLLEMNPRRLRSVLDSEHGCGSLSLLQRLCNDQRDRLPVVMNLGILQQAEVSSRRRLGWPGIQLGRIEGRKNGNYAWSSICRC